jgi:flavin-dependent dehydrogenase
MNTDFDLIIVGGGPAGAAAAIRARQTGQSCLVVERGGAGPGEDAPLWISPAGVKLCEICGLSAESLDAVPFAGLRLRAPDLRKHVDVADPELTGWIVSRDALARALLDRAGHLGAHVLRGAAPIAAALGETRHELRLSDRQVVRGKLLVVADGLESPTAALLNLPTAGRHSGLLDGASLALTVPRGKPALEVVLGPAGAAVTLIRSATRLQILLAAQPGDPAAAPGTAAAAQFAAFRAAAAEVELFQDDPRAAPVLWRVPAGLALDMDSHVGKRTLLVGAAGGFVAAFSQEGLYPAMKSGWLAAEIAGRALHAAVPQDELGAFGAVWRAELAEYLRMPNTDLSLLLPLVFNNAQMSRRVARAFLLGQKF